MANENPAVPIATTPGVQTSEHAQISAAGIMNYVGLIIGAILAVGPGLVNSANPSSKWAVIGGAIIGVSALINKTVLALGYNYGRATLKSEIIGAQQAQLVASTAQPLQPMPPAV